MILESMTAAAGAMLGATSVLAWAVRGRSSNLLASSAWIGNQERQSVAFTFDDGPSERTPDLLEVLDREGVKATFFMCGSNVRRLPEAAFAVRSAGHEIANHTETHPALYLRTATFIADELRTAQQSIQQVTGVRPSLFRPPFGARWFGLRQALRENGLRNIMWTCIANDWYLPSTKIAQRLHDASRKGAIFCLHDGRGTQAQADIRETIASVRLTIPRLLDQGYHFETVSEILCPKPPTRVN